MRNLIQICDNQTFIDALKVLIIHEDGNPKFIDRAIFLRQSLIHFGIHRITGTVCIHHQSLGQDYRLIDTRLC